MLPRTALSRPAVDALEASEARGETWRVGLSGGADSVAVLLLVWALWPAMRTRLGALHFNHRLRGSESDRDETFCRDLCRELDLRFSAGAWENRPATVNENDAREARYTFFRSAVGTEAPAVLILGHHLDDVVETQLMRLARGASSAGLAAPRPIREWKEVGQIVRPLLGLEKREIVTALEKCDVSWCEDSTNSSDTFLRNRVRRTVVPAWRLAVGEDGFKGAALTRMWLEEDDDALESFARQLKVDTSGASLALDRLFGQPRALWRRVLRRWEFSAGLSRAGFEELVEACIRGTGKLGLVNGCIEVRGNQLTFTETQVTVSAWSSASLWLGGTLILPDGSSLQAREISVTSELLQRLESKKVDPAFECFLASGETHLTVRPWRDGDRYQPLGAVGSSKLQDLFTNRKVPRTVRRQLPLVCDQADRILWVPGLPPAEGSKVTRNCVTVLQLTYTPGTITVRKQS